MGAPNGYPAGAKQTVRTGQAAEQVVRAAHPEPVDINQVMRRAHTIEGMRGCTERAMRAALERLVVRGVLAYTVGIVDMGYCTIEDRRWCVAPEKTLGSCPHCGSTSDPSDTGAAARHRGDVRLPHEHEWRILREDEAVQVVACNLCGDTAARPVIEPTSGQP